MLVGRLTGRTDVGVQPDAHWSAVRRPLRSARERSLRFGSEPAPPQRPGLERYEAAAIAAVPGPLPRSIDQIVVVLEARVTCQAVHRYVVAGDPSSTATVMREISGSSDRAPTYAEPSGRRRSSLAQFSRFAQQRVHASVARGTLGPAADFVDSECDPTQDFGQPILRPGR